VSREYETGPVADSASIKKKKKIARQMVLGGIRKELKGV
jgi:hypothetical protein